MFEWNRHKARANELKHGVSFADTFGVLEDPKALTVEDESHVEERRFVTLGMDGLGRILVLVYTWRGEKIRVISARRATPSEVKQYESQL